MFQRFKSEIGQNITNAKGWRTKRKIVVFESDDWGSIRMPGKEAYHNFLDAGYDITNDPYCRFDTLANSEDLNSLFAVLRSFKDSRDRHPKFTFNTVVANPNFSKIRNSNFSSYFYEPFTETLKNYYPDEDVIQLWREGIDEQLIKPQFHGREHVNVLMWLQNLKEDNKPLLKAFDLGFWGLPIKYYKKQNIHIQAAFGQYSQESLEFYKKNISEGLSLFEEIFGFRSKTFIANNYTYPEELNNTLFENGVVGIQGMRKQKIPRRSGNLRYKEIFTGLRNEFSQVYTVRNASFEPSQKPEQFQDIRNCLRSISNSFYWGKPAIITSHRLNFIGSLDQENRNINLKLLRELIKSILLKWPEVEFLSSDELIDVINNTK